MRYVALLRGVNLGPHRKVPMARLRELLTGAGYSDVATYLQSGNAVFEATGKREAIRLSVEGLLEEEFGMEVPVILRNAREMAAVVEACPYREAADADPTKVHATFLSELPEGDVWPDPVPPEEFTLGDGVIYMSLPDGMGRAALPGLLDKAVKGVTATTRNWRTVSNLTTLLSK